LNDHRVKTLAGWNTQTFQPANLLNEDLLLWNLRLFWDDQRHDQVYDCDPMEAREKRQHSQQTDDRRIDPEVFAQSRAYSRDHTVGRASSQWLVIGIHDIALLSMISM
jgi:hypothetical protein